MNISLLIVVPTPDSYPLLPRLLAFQAQLGVIGVFFLLMVLLVAIIAIGLRIAALLNPCSWVTRPLSLNFWAMNQGFAEAERTSGFVFGLDDLALVQTFL